MSTDLGMEKTNCDLLILSDLKEEATHTFNMDESQNYTQ